MPKATSLLHRDETPVNDASPKQPRRSTTSAKPKRPRVANAARPKQTIHSIAPAIRVRRMDKLSITSEQSSEFAFQLLEFAVQCLSFNVSQLDSDFFYNELNDVVERFDLSCRLEMPEGDVAFRLKWLLQQIQRGVLQIQDENNDASDRSALSPLKRSLHRIIQAISSSNQFSRAVEQANRQSIYQLAYGLSHEINNPLANIAARAQQLMTHATESDRRSLATIVDQSMRAHEMLAEMMRVVQPRSLSFAALDIVSFIANTIAPLQPEFEKKKLQWALSLGSTPLFVSLDNHAFSETLLAILRNAIDVCRPMDRIEVVCEALDHPRSREQWPQTKQNLENGHVATVDIEWIRISIQDTGPGLSPIAAANAWNLYFSGREHGRGLGISLANVRQMIDAHGGKVWIDSAIHAGCNVEIRLPRLASPLPRRKTISV